MTALAPVLLGFLLVAAPTDDDLEAAFDGPKASSDKRPAVPPEHNVVQRPAPPDPDEALRAQFTEALAKANAKANEGDLDGVRAALPELQQLAALAGPPRLVPVRELGARVAEKGQQARAVEEWLLACGPENVDACRTMAVDALPGTAEVRAAQLRRADECVRDAEALVQAAKPRLPPCLPAALALYRKAGDALMIARVRLAQARLSAADPKKALQAVKELGAIERACSEPRCASVRRRALRELSALELRQDHPEEAARAALLEQGLLGSSVPRAQRLYLRTEHVERACTALDAKAGKGACRKLEKSLAGGYSFRDFSTQKLGEGLPQDQAAAVNEHYGVLLEECLAAQAARLVPPDSATYKVRWMVLNDGLVDAAHVNAADADRGPLGACLREQFALWRYPRYEGEWQHVEQSFAIRASSR